MKHKLAVIVATALLLVGCSSISSGIITAKKYTASFEYWTSHCYSYDTKGNCTYSQPVRNVFPENFRFDLKNQNGDTGWVDVSPSEYDNFKVGDYYGEKR